MVHEAPLAAQIAGSMTPREGSQTRHLAPAGALILLLVRAYQRLVSPLFPATCRYIPSCSEYAAQALARHGPARGLWYAAMRVARCHPWAEGGEDPVPH